ncbi:MAG: hypothetical protein D6815_06500, partial [Candidatus Dadabacteria bacterium]
MERDAAPRQGGVVWRRIRRTVLLAGAVLFVVYAYMVSTAGGQNLAEVLHELDPRLLALPLLATFFSYVTMSLSYEGIARAAGSHIRSRDMFRITFVANTANYVFPTGGLSGFALRVVMFNKKGVSAGRAVLISFTQTLLTNLVLMVFIVYGLLHLVLTRRLDSFRMVLLTAVVVVLTVFLVACLAMVYRQSLRTRLLDRGIDLTDRLLKRLGLYERFSR